MKNTRKLFREIIDALTINESNDEKATIAYTLMYSFFGLSRSSIIAEISIEWSEEHQRRLESSIDQLNRCYPLQYILHEAYFLGRKFYVDDAVLIPRPETEELVTAVIHFCNGRQRSGMRLLDVGTGSGCIPISLALQFPEATVYATDISAAALRVARTNALEYKVPIQLLQHDILDHPLPFADLDVIISNPPYITLQEKTSMSSNVLDFEPHLALFVPDEDPLLFYRAIARNQP
jgi:release factor glutamine methyltransferase